LSCKTIQALTIEYGYPLLLLNHTPFTDNPHLVGASFVLITFSSIPFKM